VETEETYRDEFGNRRPVIDWVEEEVPEYGYQVRFTVENQSETDVAFTVRAGTTQQDFEIAAGDVLSNAAVRAAYGSSLMVMSGGRSQSYKISYPFSR
jgi:hypothetical protein